MRARPPPGGSGPAVRCAPTAVRELPGGAAWRGRGPGRAGGEPPVDQRDRRRVRVGPDRKAGEAVSLTARSPANPIPYWSRDGKTDKSPAVFEEAFADFQDHRVHRGQGGRPRGDDGRRVRRMDRGYGLAPSLSLFNSPVRRDGRHHRRDRAGQGLRRDQTELGLDRTMISSMARAGTVESAGGGRGLQPRSVGRWPSRIAGSSVRCCSPRGCGPLHHSHVGGVFETEAGDQPVARRPRPERDRLRSRHRAPALGRHRSGPVHRPVRRPAGRNPHQGLLPRPSRASTTA